MGEGAASRRSQTFPATKKVRQFWAIVLDICACDQSPRFGLAKCLGKDFVGNLAADVDNSPDRASHPISLPLLYLVSAKIVNAQGRLMRVSALDLIVPVSRPTSPQEPVCAI